MRDPGSRFLEIGLLVAYDQYDKFDGKSLTAITVAAHEVGHALQDRDAYAPLRLRTRLSPMCLASLQFSPFRTKPAIRADSWIWSGHCR